MKKLSFRKKMEKKTLKRPKEKFGKKLKMEFMKKSKEKDVEKMKSGFPSKIGSKLKGFDIKKMSARNLTITQKILSSFLPLIIIPVIILGSVAFAKTYQIISEEVTKFSGELVTQTTNNLNTVVREMHDLSLRIMINKQTMDYFEKKQESYEQVYDYIEATRDTEEFLNRILYTTEYLDSISLYQNEDTQRIYGTIPIAFRNILDEKGFESLDLYQKVLELGGRPLWIPGLEKDDPNFYLLRKLTSPTTGRDLGVLIFTIKPDVFQHVFDEIDIQRGVDLYFMDQEQTIAIHNHHTKQGDLYRSRYIEQILEEQGNTSAIIEQKGKILVYEQADNDWYVILDMPLSALMGSLYGLAYRIIGVILIFVILAVIIANGVAKSISGPIRHIQDNMKKAEEGDLRALSAFIGKTEVGRLSQSFNQMITHIQQLVGQIQMAAGSVQEDTSIISKMAEESTSVSHQVSGAVEVVAVGALEQAKDAEGTVQMVEQLTNKINSVVEHIQVVMKVTDHIQETGNEASNMVELLNKTTDESMGMSEEIRESIQGLHRKAQDIIQVVEVIEEISEETSLLALNAAIEAARAGDSGRGFAVVAEEVRKLAAQSKESAGVITQIIQRIQEQSERTVTQVQETHVVFQEQEEIVHQTGEVFHQVVASMDTVMDNIQKIGQLVESVEKAKIAAMDSMTNIAAVAEQSAASTEEVTASSEEQVASAEQLADLSHQLTEIVEKMNVSISHFTV